MPSRYQAVPIPPLVRRYVGGRRTLRPRRAGNHGASETAIHALQAAIDDLRHPSATGVQPRVGGTSGSWYGTSGIADQRSGRTIRPGDRVRIGSVSKAFFATVVLQLVHEHRVEPPTPVQLCLPGLLPAEYPDIRIS
ncbi:serine hydrolase [Streptomyces atratus]|uniref:serine hydrolase n=1 Tax=Streptomyces atratus TaxID=1893 RepID=UPI0022586066|nr:serine hydrolase [Streptomyces atratus]MCX5345727.1 beta-lactamase family protein [Streptomyces atratus]